MFTIEDAKTILVLAYMYDEHTGQRIEGTQELIVKLFDLFPELKELDHPRFIQQLAGLNKSVTF